MARIGLWFKTRWVADPRFGPDKVPIIRLVGKIRFHQANGGLSDPWDAIVDTGAPFGVLPLRLWRGLDRRITVAETSFGGINQRKACHVRAAFGYVQAQLEDDKGARSQWYEFPAFLAYTNRVPLILGFAGLLARLDTHYDYLTGQASMREH